MTQPVDPAAIGELPYRAACPMCGQEVWAGLNPPSESEDITAGHDCPGPPGAEKSSAVLQAEIVTAETEAAHAEVVEQVRAGPAPAEIATPPT